MQTPQRGFTLLELMITVAVLAILLSLGVPSFAETIRNNRVAAQTNELVTALSLARSEASKRGMPVSVCAGAAACGGAAGVWASAGEAARTASPKRMVRMGALLWPKSHCN